MWTAVLARVRLRPGARPECAGTDVPRSSAGAPDVRGATHRHEALDTGLRYPPVDPGLPVVVVDAILAAQSAWMDRARRAVGGDDESFDAHVRRPVEALAREVHLLPSS